MILRKITGTGVEMNFDIGDSYTLIHKEHNPDEFAKHTPTHEDTCFAYLAYNGGQILELYNTQHNYVMYNNGATFAHIK